MILSWVSWKLGVFFAWNGLQGFGWGMVAVSVMGWMVGWMSWNMGMFGYMVFFCFVFGLFCVRKGENWSSSTFASWWFSGVLNVFVTPNIHAFLSRVLLRSPP